MAKTGQTGSFKPFEAQGLPRPSGCLGERERNSIRVRGFKFPKLKAGYMHAVMILVFEKKWEIYLARTGGSIYAPAAFPPYRCTWRFLPGYGPDLSRATALNSHRCCFVSQDVQQKDREVSYE